MGRVMQFSYWLIFQELYFYFGKFGAVKLLRNVKFLNESKAVKITVIPAE